MRSYEFAIQMELDGERYYMEQAEKHRDSGLHTIFLTLARDERKHAQILKDRMKQLDTVLSETTSYADYKNVFQDTPDFHNVIKDIPDQLDVYSVAMDKEKESINLYKGMLEEARDDGDREVFRFLIHEEQIHYNLLEEIWSHVNRAVEWVESAEFGLREEY
ncbi:MAG TPA: ferritin family protein [Clostridia bacterium]|nr:ferritin family protein [Clostridia bacterium]